jgi:hypothetical protein
MNDYWGSKNDAADNGTAGNGNGAVTGGDIDMDI